jgi:asparagine synthase (glutamine-hydrolysing)
VPFLDHRLVELMASVHPRIKMPFLTRKDVLRRTIGAQLPAELLRAGKRGFDPPVGDWLRGKNSFLLESLPRLDALGVFSRTGLERLELPEARRGGSAMGFWSLAMLSEQAT